MRMAPHTRASTSMGPSFDTTLPEELLSTICSLLPQSSMCVLAQCSKTLNRIATPHLYANVSFHDTFRASDEPAWPFLLPFAWLIFTSARHAECVRSLAVQVGGEKHPIGCAGFDEKKKRAWLACSPKEEMLPMEEQAQMYQKVFKELCVQHTVDDTDAEELFELVKSGENEIAVVALVIAHLHNLRKLDFCYSDIGESETLIRVLDLITRGCKTQSVPQDQPNPFSVPLDIMVSGTDDKYPNEPLHVASFLSLPNIRSLYAWKAGDQDMNDDEEPDDAFSKLKPLSCAIEYMELRDSKLHHSHFDHLMKALIPEKLKTFIYEVGCTWAWVSVDHRKIMSSLAPHYSTLESLELSHEDFYPYQFDNDSENPVSVSFLPFKSLKKLKVAPVYIWGEHVLKKEDPHLDKAKKDMLRKALPETLEELWITRVDTADRNTEFITEILIPALYLVIEHREDFPALTQIYCTFCRKGQQLGWLNDLHSFGVYAKEYGVTVYIKLMNDCMDVGAERGWGWNEEVEWKECVHNPGNPYPPVEVGKGGREDMWETLERYGAESKSEGDGDA